MIFYQVAFCLVGAVFVRATSPSPESAVATTAPPGDWQPLQVDRITIPIPGIDSDAFFGNMGAPQPAVLRRVDRPVPSHTESVRTAPLTQAPARDATHDDIRHQSYTTRQHGRYSTRGEDAGAFDASPSVSFNPDTIQLHPGSVVPLNMESGTERVCSMCIRQIPVEGNFPLACNQHAVHSCMKKLHDAAQSKNKSLRCPLCPSEKQIQTMKPIGSRKTPSGTFSGTGLDGRIIFTATFSSNSVDLTIKENGRVFFSGKGFPYTMDGLSVVLADGPALGGIRDPVGPGMVLGYISMMYDPSADGISFSLQDLLITATRVD